jgi:hypothetical protein
MTYSTLINTREKYCNTDQAIIKNNIKRLMSEHNTTHKDITQLLNISLHTSYSYLNKTNINKPEIYNMLILADYWKVDITEMMKDH